MPNLILLFNHTLTEAQEQDARESLGITDIVIPPADIRNIWAQVPAETNSLIEYLSPVLAWLADRPRPGDYVLIQGEFGATWLAVKEAFILGLIPVYSTTERLTEEKHLVDGSVQVKHLFRHVIFRHYGK